MTPEPEDDTPVVDPVCGMRVVPARAAGHAAFDGRTFHFCSRGCLAKFEASPVAYLAPRDPAPDPAPAPRSAPSGGREWTCPMHPEIVRDAPGPCPICGMALEPRVATLDDRHPELDEMTRRFCWSLALTAPILALMASEMLPGQPL